MKLSHSLPIIEDAVFRMGISNEEIAFLLETEVERTYLARGRRVRARVSLENDLAGIEVFEVPPVGSWGREVMIPNPIQPNPKLFLERVEKYKQSRVAQFGWELAMVKCISIADDFSIVEVKEPAGMAEQLAVMPHNRLSSSDRASWKIGKTLYVAMCRANGEHRDGMEHWYHTDAEWMATRTDSIFLRRLVSQFFCVDAVMVHLYSGTGLIVLDEHADLGKFVGPGGENVKALETISGAKQIVVARALASSSDRWRLKKAIQQLTPVKHFQLLPPREEEKVWTILIHPDQVKRLVGVHGCRLMFISRLAGVPVKVVERCSL